MGLNPEEVSSVLRKEIERYDTKLETESVGTVLQVGDGIARIWTEHLVCLFISDWLYVSPGSPLRKQQ